MSGVMLASRDKRQAGNLLKWPRRRYIYIERERGREGERERDAYIDIDIY